jgi:DNA polymerase IV
VSVGGGDRGVVLSCSYEARKFGVYGGMPGKAAKKLCPELITLHGDIDSYSKFSREVTEIIAEAVPLFEKSSIDEFYIEMTGMDKFFGIAKYTAELRRKIVKKTKLSISYGLSSNKLVSKVATNEVKPNGETKIEHGKEKSFFAPLPVEKMPMIGKQTANVLRSIGIDTLGVLGETSVELLTSVCGRNGVELWRRANAIDDSPVISFREAKSIGTESTFHEDTNDVSFLKQQLIRMTEKVAFELRDSERLAGCITVKVRYSDFRTVTKQHVIPYSCADHVLHENAKQLFDKVYEHGERLRLIGVRLSDLVPGNYQIHMFDDTIQSIHLYQAIDAIKHKFGEKVLVKAAALWI